ncbi:uncharacterized protein LOC134689801 [Mytilus trossulus]|uniref:uncharacterized protein LOC134689801 n=1 Tax=Mytilus trossulus TaxID=6551 RepID=UPI0030060C80
MANKIVCVLGVNFCVLLTETRKLSSYCKYTISHYGYRNERFCYLGCCSHINVYNPCCSSPETDYTTNLYNDYQSNAISIEAIAGIGIGCLVGLLIFITVTVCVCKANRKTAYGEQVTTTNRRTTVSYTSTSNSTHIQPHAQLNDSQVNRTATCEPSALENGNENSSTLPPSYASVINNPALYQLTGNIQTLCVTQCEHTMTTLLKFDTNFRNQ